MFWPTLNSRVTWPRLSSDRLDISTRPSRPLSFFSWRLTISRSTSAGAAPPQKVLIEIMGLRTSGASWMGMISKATRPKVTTIKTAATTAMGRSIAVRIRSILRGALELDFLSGL